MLKNVLSILLVTCNISNAVLVQGTDYRIDTATGSDGPERIYFVGRHMDKNKPIIFKADVKEYAPTYTIDSKGNSVAEWAIRASDIIHIFIEEKPNV